jgi:hypothetical protein
MKPKEHPDKVKMDHILKLIDERQVKTREMLFSGSDIWDTVFKKSDKAAKERIVSACRRSTTYHYRRLFKGNFT